ncbi:MAG: prepilin peptidase [Thermoplasmatales archaeon]|nr:prepilin peptidase [Thermoplasmatales archaeon]
MTEMGPILDITRLIVGVAILSYASYTDIKTRKASNINWLVMGGIGGILLLIQYFTPGFGTQINYLIFIPIMIALVYVLFQLRLIFGGADAKALMAIAILVPLAPVISQFPLWGRSLMPASWFIFSNSVILFLFIPLSLLLFNIAKRNIQFPYALLGYKMDIKKARDKFVWPLEKIVDGKRKFAYMPKNFEIEDELNEFEKNGISKIWVTPKIPFMIPLLAGFICAFVLGDILYFLMGLFM